MSAAAGTTANALLGAGTKGTTTISQASISPPFVRAQTTVATGLSQAWSADGIRVINASNYYGGNGGAEWLKGQGETAAAIGRHATIQDTSELLSVFPAGVRMDKRVADKDGVVGDPTRATAERGQKLIELKVDAAVAEIEAARKGAVVTAGQPERGFFGRIWRWFFG